MKATPTVNEQHHTRKQGTTLNNTALTAAGKSFTSSPDGEECHTVPDTRYHTVQYQTDGATRYSTRQTVPDGTVPDRRYHTVQYQTNGTTRYSVRQTVPHGTVSDRRCQSVQYQTDGTTRYQTDGATRCQTDGAKRDHSVPHGTRQTVPDRRCHTVPHGATRYHSVPDRWSQTLRSWSMATLCSQQL